MSGSASPSYLAIKIVPDPGFTLNLDALTATEELGRPFRYDLELSSPTVKGSLQSMLGSSLTITANQPDKSKRYFNGIIARVTYTGLVGGAYRYRIELRPWLWLLSHTQDCAIFQNQSVYKTITDSIFRAKGFTAFSDKRQAQAGETVLEYCVQYRETALDFVTRLMEQYGIYYYFEHSESEHTLVLADDPNSHLNLPKPIPYAMNQVEYRGVEDHIWDVSSDLNFQAGSFTHRDYNFTTPSADVSGKLIQAGQHPHGSLEVYDYPALFATAGEGATLATVRMQDLAARRQIIGGTSNSRGLYAGCRFTLTGFSDPSLNQEYLVIAATISFTVAEGLSDTAGELTDTYRCAFHAIPATTQYRLPPLTHRPIVQGPQSAKVVGVQGEEVTTDSYGRIKVKFYWDRSPTQNENSSCWIRVSQVWAGNGWGGMFIPRQGQEVIVDFLEGNPDRPIVTGRVYNADMTVPYALDANKTRSTIMSNSSKGGGGSNELRFEDAKGSEEVYLHAQHDYHRVVLNNETIDITNDSTTTVSQGKRTVTVQAKDNALTVTQGNDSVTVSQGNHSITVSTGSSSITANQSITLTVGSNSIKIDTTGVTINAAKLSITTTGQISAQATGEVSVNATGALSLQTAAAMTIQGVSVAIN